MELNKLRESFLKQYRRGREWEWNFFVWFNNILKIHSFKSFNNKLYDWLFCLYTVQLYFEIKSDHYLGTKFDVWNTLFIEFGKGSITYLVEHNTNKVSEYYIVDEYSGISTTKADFWVHILTHLNEIWIIRPDDLRKLIEEERKKCIENKEKFIMAGGDNNRALGYLLNREIASNWFTIFKYDDHDNIDSVLKLKQMINE